MRMRTLFFGMIAVVVTGRADAGDPRYSWENWNPTERIAVMINKPDVWREGEPTDRIVVETDEPDVNTLLLYVLGVIL